MGQDNNGSAKIMNKLLFSNFRVNPENKENPLVTPLGPLPPLKRIDSNRYRLSGSVHH